MKHTIISWDCSYRNYFHLIDGLIDQVYNRDDFELIYIEQRTKEYANQFNHNQGFKSLEDRFNEVKDIINIKIFYLDHDLDIPYHYGHCANLGLKQAKGEIISIMDGDILLTPNFLTLLSEAHKKNTNAVINMERRVCAYPYGVNSFTEWMNAPVDFNKCIQTCPDHYTPIPLKVVNKAPMISAKREYWERIEGYDLNLVWSTFASKIDHDTNARLEIATGTSSFCLQGAHGLHLWHPIVRGRGNPDVKIYVDLQDQLIDWSKNNQERRISEREEFGNRILNENEELINKVLKMQEGETIELAKMNLKARALKTLAYKVKKTIMMEYQNKVSLYGENKKKPLKTLVKNTYINNEVDIINQFLKTKLYIIILSNFYNLLFSNQISLKFFLLKNFLKPIDKLKIAMSYILQRSFGTSNKLFNILKTLYENNLKIKL